LDMDSKKLDLAVCRGFCSSVCIVFGHIHFWGYFFPKSKNKENSLNIQIAHKTSCNHGGPHMGITGIPKPVDKGDKSRLVIKWLSMKVA
jgi:hypothetical protein